MLDSPRRPETWLAEARAVLGDLVLAVLIVIMVPLVFFAVAHSIAWLGGAVLWRLGATAP